MCVCVTSGPDRRQISRRLHPRKRTRLSPPWLQTGIYCQPQRKAAHRSPFLLLFFFFFPITRVYFITSARPLPMQRLTMRQHRKKRKKKFSRKMLGHPPLDPDIVFMVEKYKKKNSTTQFSIFSPINSEPFSLHGQTMERRRVADRNESDEKVFFFFSQLNNNYL